MYYADYERTDFHMISHTSGTTDEGYPTLTMKYSETITYAELSGEYLMINYAKQVYVGTDLWSIDVQTDKEELPKYLEVLSIVLIGIRRTVFGKVR